MTKNDGIPRHIQLYLFTHLDIYVDYKPRHVVAAGGNEGAHDRRSYRRTIKTSRCEALQSTNCMLKKANLREDRAEGFGADQGRGEIGQMQVVISGRYRSQYSEF